METLIVLALFPLGPIYAAVIDLIERIQTQVPVTSRHIPPLDGTWLPVGLSVLLDLIELAPVALVAYLLIRSGEGLSSIGLGRGETRTDLALLLPVFLVTEWISFHVGDFALHRTGLHGFGLVPSPVPLPNGALMIAMGATGIVAGVLEEVVVLGYLVRRLEQRALRPVFVVAIAVAVRVAYHLYYGWNVLPIALWALVSVLLYRRVRRLMPFIICHAVWDIGVALRVLYPHVYTIVWVAGLLATALMTILWAGWTPDGQGHARHTAAESLVTAD